RRKPSAAIAWNVQGEEPWRIFRGASPSRFPRLQHDVRRSRWEHRLSLRRIGSQTRSAIRLEPSRGRERSSNRMGRYSSAGRIALCRESTFWICAELQLLALHHDRRRQPVLARLSFLYGRGKARGPATCKS